MTTPLRDKETSAAMRRNEAMLNALLETAVEGILTINAAGRIESVNPAACRMFGYAANELLGTSVDRLMPTPYCEEHGGYLQRYLRTGQRKIIGIGREVIGLCKDGTTFPMYLSVGEFQLDEGRFFAGIIRDISEQKRAESRLLQAERLATIGEVATGVAHESRNALQRIRANVEMLQMDFEDQPEVNEQLLRIANAADHISSLLSEVRNYASPLNLEKDIYSLATIWRQSWAHVTDVHDHRDTSLRESLNGFSTECNVNPSRMDQVFRNLFENAIAAQNGAVVVEIACRADMFDGQSALTFTVRDDGPGLTSEARDKVFEAFYTTKTAGTGLGMAIVKRIIEAHGGRIRVGDTNTIGAEFVLTIPYN